MQSISENDFECLASTGVKSHVLSFPLGLHLNEAPIGNTIHLDSAARGDYVLIRPLKEYAVGVFDLKSKSIPAAVKQPAVDVYDQAVVHERISGELSLDVIGTEEHIATLRLPQARLGGLRTATISPDLKWLAISNRTRGAVWDLEHNIRISHVRSFHGAWFADDLSIYVDFPKYQEVDRQIGRLFPFTGADQAGYKIGDVLATQHGAFLMVTTPRKKPQYQAFADADVEIKDVRDGRQIWSHHFEHELPAFSFGADTVLLEWPLSQAGGRQEFENFPDLKDRGAKEDYFCELMDLRKNIPVGKLIIKTNRRSFRLEYTASSGDWVIAAASDNQVITYSLASGEEKGHFFGVRPIVSSRSGLLALENESGQIRLYDLATSKLRQQYVFSDPISFKTFSPDGQRLFVLTTNQTAYIVNVTVSN